MISTRVFYRGLATAKSVKPPIQLFGIDGTYATALYSASVQDSSVAQSFQELSKVDNLIKTDAKVKNFLLDPSLTKQDKTSVIETIAKKLSLEKTTTNFLKVLSENNRLDHLSGIYEKFGQLNDASQGVVEAKITSAKPLESKILKRLQTSIAKSSFVGEGKTLKLSNDVNPDILGGLIVEVGDRTVDLSIQAKVAKINQSLAEAL